MRYTISQLVEKVNSLNVENDVSSNSDARRKTLTERRVRDYQTKKLIDEPEKDGRNSYYNENHVNQLLTIREMQKEGLSDSVIKKIGKEPYSQYYGDSSTRSMEAESLNYINTNLVGSSLNNEQPNNDLKNNLLNTLNNIVGSSSSVLDNTSSLIKSQAITTNVLKEIGSQYLAASSSSLQKFNSEIKQHFYLNQFMTIIVDKDKKFNELEKEDLIKKFSEFIKNI